MLLREVRKASFTESGGSALEAIAEDVEQVQIYQPELQLARLLGPFHQERRFLGAMTSSAGGSERAIAGDAAGSS